VDIQPVENYGAGLIPRQSMRSKVDRLEQVLQTVPQVDCPVRNLFAPGMYAREITIPAGTVVSGAVHKTDNFVVLSKGRLRYVTDGEPVEISAPHIMTCKAGSKNAVVALEDSVWINFFPTTETDIGKLVETLTESTADELLGGSKNKQLAQAGRMEQLEAKCHSE